MNALLLTAALLAIDVVHLPALPESGLPVRIRDGSEHRDATRIPPGPDYVIDFGPTSAGAVLRLSLLANRTPDARLTVRIESGGVTVDRYTVSGGAGWADRRIPLQASGTGGRIVLASEEPFWVGACEVFQRSTRPNVLICLVDTLRQDRLSCYGYHRNTSPNLDALSKDSIRFTRLLPPSSWTRPSVASLLTGTHPYTHRGQDRTDVLNESAPSLASELKNAGYATFGIVTNPNCFPMWGFGKGFERYACYLTNPKHGGVDELVADETIAIIREADGRPWFIYAHMMGPHQPYNPPPPYDLQFRERKYDTTKKSELARMTHDLYDGEVAHSDAQIGRVLDELRRLDQLDNTLVIVVSDHGEEFWEHGVLGHGFNLFDASMRVPFLVRLPKGEFGNTVRSDLIEMVDVAPTVLEIVDVESPASFQGASFAKIYRGEKTPSKSGHASLHLGVNDLRAAWSGPFKYIRNQADDSHQWFNLDEDPTEQSPRSTAISGAEHLRADVEQRTAEGSHGVHLVFVRDANGPHKIEGTVNVSPIRDASLYFPHRKTTLHQTESAVQFSIQLERRSAIFRNMPFEKSWKEADFARLRIDTDPDAEITLDISIDGKAIAESDIGFGWETATPGLRGETIRALDVIAAPNQFESARIPKQYAVYLWYSPDTSRIADADLDSEMRDQLEALGYIE